VEGAGHQLFAGADLERNTRDVMDAELTPKEILERVLQLKEHL
jgi:hypothetical protein